MKQLILLFFLTIISFGQNTDFDKNKDWMLYSAYDYYLKKIPKDVISNFYFKSSTDRKEVAITFDDGPLKNTKEILSFLLQNDVPATFFLVADKLNKNNTLFYQDSLIEVGMHTFSHLDYSNLTRDEKNKDIYKCIEIFNKYNLQTTYFRPAYGIIDRDIAEILNRNSLDGVIWSLDSQDWNGYKEERIINHIIDSITHGSIILFHDSLNVSDLKQIINKIRLKGFNIVALSELMKHSSEFPN